MCTLGDWTGQKQQWKKLEQYRIILESFTWGKSFGDAYKHTQITFPMQKIPG